MDQGEVAAPDSASSKANRTQRSTPKRVLTEPCVTTSAAVPFRKNPPSPAYAPSVFSRTTAKSIGTPAPTLAVRLERAQVDVQVELEAHPQQQTSLEHSGRHLG